MHICLSDDQSFPSHAELLDIMNESFFIITELRKFWPFCLTAGCYGVIGKWWGGYKTLLVEWM